MDEDLSYLLSTEHIREFYNLHKECWPEDCFSLNTTKQIRKAVIKFINKLPDNSIILNAGSGNTVYEDILHTIYNVDIAEKKVSTLPNAYVCSIESMPFKENMFDCIICVGTVINYANLEKSLNEFRRVLKKGGYLILEYERSGSGLVNSAERNEDTINFLHTYYGELHANKLYSDKYVKKQLNLNGLELIKNSYFNTSIPFIELFSTQKIAEKMNFTDSFLSHIPFINNYAHNKIVICKQK